MSPFESVKTVLISELTLDERLQPRVEMNDDWVSEYAEVLKDGGKLPPIEAYRVGSTLYLTDGLHRYYATKMQKAVKIQAVVHDGTFAQAQLSAFRANTTHGHRLSSADRVRMVKALFANPDQEEVTKSDGAIAAVIGCSRPTVLRIRREINPKAPKAEKREGKDGKQYHVGKNAEKRKPEKSKKAQIDRGSVTHETETVGKPPGVEQKPASKVVEIQGSDGQVKRMAVEDYSEPSSVESYQAVVIANYRESLLQIVSKWDRDATPLDDLAHMLIEVLEAIEKRSV